MCHLDSRMDVGELRDAILAADTLAERRRTFRVERVGNVVAGETPIPLGAGPKTVLHVVPLGAFASGSHFDLAGLAHGNLTRLHPITPGIGHHRHNFDGYLTSFAAPSPNTPNSYLQVFRNGIVEAVDEWITQNSRKAGFLPATHIEKGLVAVLSRILTVQQELGITPPVLVMLTLVGVGGLNITRNDYGFLSQPSPIDRDVLMAPEILVEAYPDKVDSVMRPIFDAVWNAAGYEACPNYDDDGNWSSNSY